MITHMTEEQIEEFYLFAQLIGYTENTGLKLLEPTAKERAMLNEANRMLMAMFVKYTERLEPKLAMKLHKNMKNFTVQCLSKEKARIRNKDQMIYVKKEAVDTLAEQAMEHCNPCTRNQKACKLKKIFKELDMPEFDPESKGCKYCQSRVEKPA